MRGKLRSGLYCGILALGFTVCTAVAEEDHKVEALRHAEAAAVTADGGDAASAGEHAKIAKEHAEAAEREKANPHLEAAIVSLDGAIEHGKQGHAEQVGKAAHAAVTHLKAAKKAF